MIIEPYSQEKLLMFAILAAERTLEEDVKHDTSSDFKRVLIALLQACREEGCDEGQAREDCEELYQAGEA